MALTETGQVQQTSQIPEWLRNMYLQMLASAQPYVFGTASRTDLPVAGDPNLKDPGKNNAPVDSDGVKWWGARLGLNLNETNNRPASETVRAPIFQVSQGSGAPATPSPYVAPWNSQKQQTPGYQSPWQAPVTPPPYQQPAQQQPSFVGGLAPGLSSGSQQQPGQQTSQQPSQPGIQQPTVQPPVNKAVMPASPFMPAGSASVSGLDGSRTNVPVNPMHYASNEGAQFAQEQLQRLFLNQQLTAGSISNDSPFSSGPGQQATVVRQGTDPGSGPNAGLVANLYKTMPKDVADQMMRDEMKLLGWKRGGLIQALAQGGVVGMAEGGYLDETDPYAGPGAGTGSTTTGTDVTAGVPAGAITGQAVGSYTPYPGQRYGEMGDLTQMYLAGTERMNQGLVDPYVDVRSPVEISNFALDRMAEGFTNPDMAYNQQIRNWAQETPFNSYQAGSYDPSAYTGENMMGGTAGALQGYTGGNYQAVGTGKFTDPGVASAYMDPYAQNVIDVQKQKATEAYREMLPAIGANAVQSGAFGGGRHGIVEGMANREFTRSLDEIQKTGTQDAYRNAQEQYERDRGAGLQAALANQAQYGQTQDRNLAGLTTLSGQGLQAALQAANLNEQSRQFGANLTDQGRQAQSGLDMEAAKTAEGIQSSIVNSNLNAMNARTGAAQTLMNAGDQYTNQTLNSLNALRSAGAQADAYNQQFLDYDYQNFLNQRDYPLQMMNYYSGLLNGVPAPVSTEQYTYGQQASPYSGILGLATAGLGAVGSYYNNKSGG